MSHASKSEKDIGDSFNAAATPALTKGRIRNDITGGGDAAVVAVLAEWPARACIAPHCSCYYQELIAFGFQAGTDSYQLQVCVVIEHSRVEPTQVLHAHGIEACNSLNRQRHTRVNSPS